MGIFNDETTSASGSGSIGQQGPQGPPGVGFILTENGDYNLENKKMVNVKQGTDPNDAVINSQIQLLDGAQSGTVVNNKAVIYSNTGSVHTNSIYLQDTPDGAGSSNDVRLMTEHQSYQNIHLNIPDLKNFDGHGGRAKSEIMVTSTEQHITGRKTFFDINVLKPDNDDQAANKKYVDDSVKKIPSPDLSGYLEKDGSSPMTGNLDMGNKQITNLGANIQNTYDVVNLGFCDTKYQQKVSNSDLDMDQHRIKDMKHPTDDNDAVTKHYVDQNFLNRINPDALDGDLDMRGHTVKFLELSSEPSAAARVSELNLKADKNYVDNRDNYVINTFSTLVNTTFNNLLRRDGTNSMTDDLNLDDHKLINVKEPTNDKDGVNKKYFEDKLAESHLVSSHKENVFKYLFDTDESASEYNIRVNGIDENFQESAHQNKKAYSITLIKDSDGSNDYRSGISFNIYPLPIGTFTMIFEYYWPESTNVSLSTQGTTVYIHKQVYKAFDNYGKLLVQINNNSKDTPDRITLVIHGRTTRRPDAYLIIYGIKDWSNSVDPAVYDGFLHNMFISESNWMKMNVGLNMNGKNIRNLPIPSNPTDATTKQYVDFNVPTKNLSGNWDFKNKRLINISSPSDDNDALTLISFKNNFLTNYGGRISNGVLQNNANNNNFTLTDTDYLIIAKIKITSNVNVNSAQILVNKVNYGDSSQSAAYYRIGNIINGDNTFNINSSKLKSVNSLTILDTIGTGVTLDGSFILYILHYDFVDAHFGIKLDIDGNINLNNRRLRDAKDPVKDSDLVSKRWVKQLTYRQIIYGVSNSSGVFTYGSSSIKLRMNPVVYFQKLILLSATFSGNIQLIIYMDRRHLVSPNRYVNAVISANSELIINFHNLRLPSILSLMIVQRNTQKLIPISGVKFTLFYNLII